MRSDNASSPSIISNKNAGVGTTIILSDRNFKGLFDGSFNPQIAFGWVSLKIEADISTALKLADIF
jgi:hypothetical protein